MSALSLGVYKIDTVVAGRCFDSTFYNSEQKNIFAAKILQSKQ